MTLTDGLEVVEHGVGAGSHLLAVVGAQVDALAGQGGLQDEGEPLDLVAGRRRQDADINTRVSLEHECAMKRE
jgi:hypothetical protein